MQEYKIINYNNRRFSRKTVCVTFCLSSDFHQVFKPTNPLVKFHLSLCFIVCNQYHQSIICKINLGRLNNKRGKMLILVDIVMTAIFKVHNQS